MDALLHGRHALDDEPERFSLAGNGRVADCRGERGGWRGKRRRRGLDATTMGATRRG